MLLKALNILLKSKSKRQARRVMVCGSPSNGEISLVMNMSSISSPIKTGVEM